MVLLEVCVDDAEGLASALRGGAQRIELCAELGVGGLTPSRELLRRAREECGAVPVFAMLRPRGGSFVYTAREADAIRRELDGLLDAGAEGIVFGALDPQGRPDATLVAEVRERAGSLPLTFHRAFDEVRGPAAALRELKGLGVDRVLSSGGLGPAIEHLDALSSWCGLGDVAPRIVVGGGVRSHNVAAIVAATGTREVHSSARREGRTDASEVRRLCAELAGSARS